MLAIAARPGSTEPYFVEVSEPALPGRGEVLCRTRQLGICGTDREILLSARPMTPRGAGYLILGHECLARIECVGEGVEGWHAGDLAVPMVRRAIAEGEPRADLLALGRFTERGIFSEHGFSAPLWLDRPQYLRRVPPDIESVAVLAEPMSVAEKGIRESLAMQRARRGSQVWCEIPPRVLVTGMGPIGFAAVIACFARQWPVVHYGRDVDDSPRAALSRALGARYVAADTFVAAPDDVEAGGFDLVLECTGSAGVMVHVAQALASCGIMVWLGSVHRPKAQALDLERLMRQGILRNHLHLGSVNASPHDVDRALCDLQAAWQTKSQELESLVTARVVPAESLPYYTRRPDKSIKTVVMYE